MFACNIPHDGKGSYRGTSDSRDCKQLDNATPVSPQADLLSIQFRREVRDLIAHVNDILFISHEQYGLNFQLGSDMNQITRCQKRVTAEPEQGNVSLGISFLLDKPAWRFRAHEN